VDKETIEILLELLNPLHGELDQQLYDERLREELEIPRDRQWNVDISEGMERDLCQAVLILEARKRDAVSYAAAHGFINALNAAKLEYSALSWSGMNVFGDRKSIEEVKRLTQVENYVTALREQGQRDRYLIADLREEAKQLKARLDCIELRDPADLV